MHDKTFTYRRRKRLSLSGQSVHPNPRDILLFTSTSKFHLRGRQKQHQGALPRTISGSWGGCLRCGQMGHYVIECTAKMLFVKEDNEGEVDRGGATRAYSVCGSEESPRCGV